MRNSSSSGKKDPSALVRSGSRGETVLGMPQITSCGLYHQSRGRVPSRDSSPSSHSRSHQQKRGNSGSFAEGGSSGEEKRHAMVMLEQHTSAAKDGVIEVLTVEASKLGASLERAVVAKKEVEDRAQRLQGRVEEEGTRRKDLELRLQRSQAEWEGSQRTLTDIRWEVDTLRSKLLEVTESAKQRVQEETEQRLAAEDRLRQEHAVATDYLRELYDDGGKPVPEGLVSETLVQELRDFGRALQERDVRLRAGAERLDELVGQVDIERQGRAVVQDQLDIAQERLDSARLKIRQMSGQLNMEAQDNENLRAHLRGLEEESDRRAKDQEERKARAQQRKRGGMRDAMADSKAKDDRIKALENNLMQERERLEGELQSARSDYEESAKDSKRKIARLHRRCMELEYRASQQQQQQERSTGGGAQTIEMGGEVESSAASRDAHAKTIDVVSAVPGLISAKSFLPWRRESENGTTTAIAASVEGGKTAKPSTKSSTTGTSRSSSTSGSGRLSAAQLPDPSHRNVNAPAWMRVDLAADKLGV